MAMTLRLPKELEEKIEQFCEYYSVPKSMAIRLLIQQGLDHFIYSKTAE